MSDISIQLATDPLSCRAAEDLQREVWGQPERALVPAEQIRAVVHNGGMLLLARSADEVVGFCFAFVGLEDGAPILCSHMLAVLPAARSQGLGRALKLAQRDVARERGFHKITWTFDPLQARNAYLNLHRLGAYAHHYYVDHYGAMEDDINRGMPTDRLLAEWLIDDDQKSGAAAGSGRGLPWILPALAGAAADHAAPADPQLVHVGGGGGLVAVPASIDAVKQADRALMLRWRLAVRAALTSAFDAGLQAVDLLRDAGDGVGAYVLRRSP